MLKAGTTCWRVETAPRAALLVDMAAYLEAAKSALAAATSSIHFLNWAFDPDTVVDHEPDGPGSEPLRIGPFLRGLAQARPELEIRILCWQSALPVAATQRFFPLRSRSFFAGSSVDFRLDGSHVGAVALGGRTIRRLPRIASCTYRPTASGARASSLQSISKVGVATRR